MWNTLAEQPAKPNLPAQGRTCAWIFVLPDRPVQLLTHTLTLNFSEPLPWPGLHQIFIADTERRQNTLLLLLPCDWALETMSTSASVMRYMVLGLRRVWTIMCPHKCTLTYQPLPASTCWQGLMPGQYQHDIQHIYHTQGIRNENRHWAQQNCHFILCSVIVRGNIL